VEAVMHEGRAQVVAAVGGVHGGTWRGGG
jgi:hypothetical protein